jgi:hypothetical protein
MYGVLILYVTFSPPPQEAQGACVLHTLQIERQRDIYIYIRVSKAVHILALRRRLISTQASFLSALTFFLRKCKAVESFRYRLHLVFRFVVTCEAPRSVCISPLLVVCACPLRRRWFFLKEDYTCKKKMFRLKVYIICAPRVL